MQHHMTMQHLALLLCAGMAAPWAMAGDAAVVVERPGSGTNHIEVSGNSASGTKLRCPDGRVVPAPTADVNSVNINGEALRGKTIVIAGRNSQGVTTPEAACGAAPVGRSPAANVNSINIR
ncbi:hypothetical protein AAFF27_06020 [Xylophilus sp. GW821-FHT01B05]